MFNRVKGFFNSGSLPPMLNYSQLTGSCTISALEQAMGWDCHNVADASDREGQSMASYFIDYHKILINRSDMHGLIEHSASLANESALMIARDSTKRRGILCTNLTHSSIAQACEKLGLHAIVVDADPSKGYQVNHDQLTQAVKEHGKDIGIVVSTFGTTQLGNIEDLAEHYLVKQLRLEGAWLHVDAAYGGVLSKYAIDVERTGDPLVGNEFPDADSYTLDPYKFIGKPGCALLLSKELPVQTIHYYHHSPLTLATTMSLGPIAAWFHSLKECSLHGVREIAYDCFRLTKFAANELRSNGIELVMSPELTVIPVALGSKEEVNHVCDKLIDDGFIVGRIRITGRDYETHGVRIAITPKRTELNLVNVDRVCSALRRRLWKKEGVGVGGNEMSNPK